MELSQEKIHEFTLAMRKASETSTGRPWSDIEARHINMDEVLLDIAKEVGCSGVVEIFNKTDKCYI